MPKAPKKTVDLNTKISEIFRRECSGIQINMMDIGKIFAAGRAVVAEGGDDAALTQRIKATVEALRAH